jgi:hypothetical protein
MSKAKDSKNSKRTKDLMSPKYSFEEKLKDLGLEYYVQLTIIQNEGRDAWYMDDTTSTKNPLTKEQTIELNTKIHKYFPDLKTTFKESKWSGGFTVYKKDIDWKTIDEKKYGELLGYTCPVNNLGEMVKTSETWYGGGFIVKMKNGKYIDISVEWCFVENPDTVQEKVQNRVQKITHALQKDPELWNLIEKVEGGVGGEPFHNTNYYLTKLQTIKPFTNTEKSQMRNKISMAKQLQDYKYQWQNPKHREILYEIIDKLDIKYEWTKYDADTDEQIFENMKVWEAPYLKRLNDTWSIWYIF